MQRNKKLTKLLRCGYNKNSYCPILWKIIIQNRAVSKFHVTPIFFIKPNQKSWAPSATTSAAARGSLLQVPAQRYCLPHHGQSRMRLVWLNLSLGGAVNLFLSWRKSPYFCHNGGIVCHCLCHCPWSSSACSSTMCPITTSWAMMGMLGFYYCSRQCH